MSELRLPPTTDSVPLARRFVRQQLTNSGCDVDTVVLLLSELVTNAVLHARSEIVVSLKGTDDTVRVEVADASPTPPRLHRFHVESATGRGLRLLDRLSMSWGVERTRLDDRAGKVVWFEVGTASETAWESFADSLFAEEAAE